MAGSMKGLLEANTVDRADALQRLQNLGLVSRDEERRFLLPSFFLSRWLEDLEISLTSVLPA